MKKLLLLLAVAGFAFFASCDTSNQPEEPEEPEKTVWRSTHQYTSVTVNEQASDEIKQTREKDISIDVTEAESYRLAFREDGTGYGSGVNPDGNGRYEFVFTWELSDDRISMSGYNGIFYMDDTMGFLDRVTWKIEESSDNEMVLMQDGWIYLGSGPHGPWRETHIYRYTFEKVE